MLGLQLVGGGGRRVVVLPLLSGEAGFQTIGRVELQLDDVRTISRQRMPVRLELSNA